MDDQTIRIRLEEVKSDLARIELERDALLGLVQNYERLLRLAVRVTASQLPLPAAEKAAVKSGLASRFKGKQPGGISNRVLIRDIVKQANGEPLHCQEIWRRAVAQGATTDSTTPLNIVDSMLRGWMAQGEPLQKLGGRRWRWATPVVPEQGLQHVA